MSTDFIPEDALYAVSEMKQVSRNKFRIELTSGASAGGSSVISCNLPENSIIDLHSLKFIFDAVCTGSTVGAATVYGKLPAHATSLFQSLSVYINGQQVQQSQPEFGTIAAALRLTKTNIDHDNSIARLCSHSYIRNDDVNDDETLVAQNLPGFLSDGSSRYLNTALVGNIQIRLVVNDASCLVPKEDGQDVGVNFTSADARTAASNVRFTLQNMYWSVDTVSLDPMYNEMLSERLQSVGLQVNYREMYLYELGNITAGQANLRWGLSSQSVDNCTSFFRDSNHTATGIRGEDLADAGGVNAFVSNSHRFRAYNGGIFLKPGAFRSQYSVNSVRYPQFQSTIIDSAANAAYVENKVGLEAGHLITSKQSYENGKFVDKLILNMPTRKGVAIRSGYDSRGLNTQMVYQVQGMTVPAATPTGSQETGILSAACVVSTTATLNIALGRDLMTVF